MPVRKTESRIPENYQASDLGQANLSADGGSAVVSYITSPLVVGRRNTFIVFITDAALAASVQSFEWSFVESDGAPTVETTAAGEISYSPGVTGRLSTTVRCLDGGGSALAALTLNQSVVAAHAGLEAMIVAGADEPGPSAANPDVSRELVNDYNIYYQNVVPRSGAVDDGFRRLVFTMLMESALQRNVGRRQADLSEVAAVLNAGSAGFATLAGRGLGIAGLRPALLAMIVGPHLPWTELPTVGPAHTLAEEELRHKTAALPETARIDLFNLARFPKSSITQCGRVIETLRDRYFNGIDFDAVLRELSGTRAHWINRHYREGPLTRA
ncbi:MULTISPECIES: hypothetical protein [unclassified Chelatococcus]|uniref:hypothetical protein n=1 Tax=unclassified Chelatococcus TaxID=2638111 RepID=UPI001BD0AE09|nr:MULTISPECIES: hypothetical protein [unclassified Chelatococcus]MBS7699818.1 hypothetical protein [Chelatococcus sp. YT9]MBX3558164.1 hypothetical protein [Chelatococcus sp.]